MGSSISKGKRHQETAIYGEMYAQTDKAGYSAGDTVTGHIYVNILTPYPAKKLLLRLKGTEIVDLVLQKSKRKTAVEKYYTDKNIIINLTVPVLDCPPVIQGQYAIPFAFIVPEHLPSSFHQEGQRYLANISYRLEAILEPKNPKETPKLKYKQDLIVRRSTSKVTSLDNQTLIRTPISTCYCLRRGSNVLSVSLEKHLYSPGEVIQAKICLDNTNCKLDNLSISFRLKQKLRLKIKNKKFKREFIKLEDQKAGVQKGQTTQNLSFLLKLPSFQEGDYQLTKRDHMQSLLLSLKENNNVITSATKSKFISSEYFLEVSCPMAGRHCPTTLTRVYPIEIYHPDIRLPSVVAPSNWHPIQLKTANVSFASPAEGYDLPYLASSIEMGQNTMGIRKLDDEQGRQLQSQFNLDQKAQPQYVQT